MIAYALTTLLTCLMIWHGEKSERKWTWRILAALPLTLLAALRWDCGTDFYYTYHPLCLAVKSQLLGGTQDVIERVFAADYSRLSAGPGDSAVRVFNNFIRVYAKMEYGFRHLVDLVFACGGEVRALMAACAAISSACVFFCIYRQTKNPALAVYFYVTTSNYFLGYNITRQFVALALGLVAVEFAVRRRWWLFVPCVAAAASFHVSAWVLLPCYFLAKPWLRPRWCFVAILAAFGASFYAAPALEFLLRSAGMRQYANYFHQCFAADGFETVFFALNVCFLALGTWYWKRGVARCGYYAIWYYMTVLGTVALAFSATIPLMKRINYYFAAPQFLWLPEMLAIEENPKLRKALTVMAILAFALETIVAVGLMGKNGVCIYRTRFFSHIYEVW